jgi:hypothetical protein
MSTEWVVTTSAERVVLDPRRHGEATFTVTNPGTQATRAVFEVVADAGTTASWFTVEEPQRLIRGGASVSYVVRADVPASVAVGTYAVRGRVYPADSAPEESSALSNRVVLEVAAAPAPRRRPRMWWIAVGTAAVLVVAAVAIGVALRGPRPAPPSATVTVPDLSRLDVDHATAALRQAGLTVGALRYRRDPGNLGQVTQSIPAGTAVARGTPVGVTFSVDFQAPILTSPVNNAFVPATSLAPLVWSQPERYVHTWRVRVYQYACYYALPGATPICGQLLTIDQKASTPSFPPTLTFSFRPSDVSVGIFHFGLVYWQVTPVDDFGVEGPASAQTSFVVTH